MMVCEGVFRVHSPNTANEQGWAVTPRSVRTLLAIVLVGIMVGVAEGM